MINNEQTGTLNATRSCCYGSQRRPLPPKSLRGYTMLWEGQSRDAFQAIPLEETSPRCNKSWYRLHFLEGFRRWISLVPRVRRGWFSIFSSCWIIIDYRVKVSNCKTWSLVLNLPNQAVRCINWIWGGFHNFQPMNMDGMSYLNVHLTSL